jgi:hypothetical protein
MKDKVFSEKLRERLSRYKYADWAADLTEETAEALLWAIGESHIRPLEHALSGDSPHLPPVVLARIVESVRITSEIVHGSEFELEEVHRRIREAMSAADPKG